MVSSLMPKLRLVTFAANHKETGCSQPVVHFSVLGIPIYTIWLCQLTNSESVAISQISPVPEVWLPTVVDYSIFMEEPLFLKRRCPYSLFAWTSLHSRIIEK